MAKVNLQLKSTTTNAKSQTTTITNVNPNATDSELLQLTHKLNAFTTNTYTQTDKITTLNLDGEGDSRQTPTLTASQSTITATSIPTTGIKIPITYTGNGRIYLEQQGANYVYTCIIVEEGATNLSWTKLNSSSVQTTSGKLYIHATETTQYKSPEPFEITVIGQV